jgi:hypothetical protein
MFLTFEARRPCVLCGYRLRHLLMDTFRVNKRSLTKTGKGPSLGFSDRICPECRTPAGMDEPKREVYAATAGSAAEIRAYRLRRWPELAGEGAAA